jgi:hypothetical protein
VNAGTTDIVINLNTAPACNDADGHLPFLFQPAQGPIDWNCSGVLDLHAVGDINNDASLGQTLHGFDE